jgi:hypothetical protein
MTHIADKKYIVTMPDGSKWAVPIMEIAMDRANWYKGDYEDSINLSLHKDTLPLFESTHYEIHDWASGNMNWDDVESIAIEIKEETGVDYQEGWLNGDWEIQE